MPIAIFWTVATVMVVFATVAVLAPIFWVRSVDDDDARRRQAWSAGAIAALVPLCALGLYAWLGSPEAVRATAPAAAATATPHAGSSASTNPAGAPGAGDATAGDLGEAVAHLESRLARQPDDPSGWDLLEQSYEFAGRSADAAAARQRRLPPGAGQAPAARADTAAPTASVALALDAAGLAAIDARPPSSNDALVQKAQEARRAREFSRALAAFAELENRNALDASLWADYADATAAQRGRLDEASEPLIRRALALDPRHAKALWLLGSLQVQRGDHAAALDTWLAMQKLLAPDSSDGRLIAANVAEARAMLAAPGAGSARPMAAPATAAATPARTTWTAIGGAPEVRAAGAVALRGDIQLDARWHGKVTAGTVLYVYARAVGQQGPPVAVLRTTAARWPLAFVLDDSLAMLPGRTLSAASRVIVEARLSRSGSADPQPGDLRGQSAALDPRTAGPLHIVIAEEIS